MNTVATRVVEALQGDTATIRELAGALARNDLGAVRTVLASRGVELSDAEVDEIVRFADGAGAGGAYTYTFTYTFT